MGGRIKKPTEWFVLGDCGGGASAWLEGGQENHWGVWGQEGGLTNWTRFRVGNQENTRGGSTEGPAALDPRGGKTRSKFVSEHRKGGNTQDISREICETDQELHQCMSWGECGTMGIERAISTLRQKEGEEGGGVEGKSLKVWVRGGSAKGRSSLHGSIRTEE